MLNNFLVILFSFIKRIRNGNATKKIKIIYIYEKKN